MFEIPIAGPANVFCDNDSVVNNCTRPDSTIKKKHNAIAYHKVREAVATGVIRVAWESLKTNLADMLTKPLSTPDLQKFCSYIFHKMCQGFNPKGNCFPGSTYLSGHNNKQLPN